jgi:cell wall-associated NlpC family hydrolase
MDMELVKQARSYLGTPFKHRGRTKQGLDCAGLVVRSFIDLGRPVKDLKVYGREPYKDGLRQVVQSNALSQIEDLEPGDILLMCFLKEPHHIGLVGDYSLGGLSLIHSYGEVGRVVEHRLDEAWKARILEAYRYNQL